MQIIDQQTVGEIVAQDYRAAAVFSSYDIDFCCRGHRTVAEVCQNKGISQDELLRKLDAASQSGEAGQPDFKTWPTDLLVDFVEKKHHRYVREKAPMILEYLYKLCKVHGNNHPELYKITEEFSQAANELSAHMKKEETILFPYIREQVLAGTGEKLNPPFHTVESPIRMMMDEHSKEGDRFLKISALSDHYTAPSDGCTTYRVAYAMLKDFEADLHLHIHLENNIIFPAAVEMEKMMVSASH